MVLLHGCPVVWMALLLFLIPMSLDRDLGLRMCATTAREVRNPISFWQRIAPVAIAMAAGFVGGAVNTDPNKYYPFFWIYLSFAFMSFATSYFLPHAATSSGLAYMPCYVLSIHLIGPIDQSSTSGVGHMFHFIHGLPLIALSRLGRWARRRRRHAPRCDDDSPTPDVGARGEFRRSTSRPSRRSDPCCDAPMGSG